jgi:predicted CXXCH cytochrome family protein
VVLTAVLATATLAAAAWVLAQQLFDPHAAPGTGVLRVVTDPPSRGHCRQCHPMHAEDDRGFPYDLFTENTNRLAFWSEGATPCHGSRPRNYPLGENDRIPEPAPDAGYFEANTGGTRRAGVDLRGRWPGELAYTSPTVTGSGHFVSPHAQDPDMPRREPGGDGLCLNCHNPHGTAARDLLVARYGGIGGHAAVGPPAEYALCFRCHGQGGPAGMDYANKLIADFYDAGLNGERAGHQIRKNHDIALSWPAYVRVGDMLPCYDCHSPHGSEGNDRVRPNAYVLSDQRPGWSGLTDTINDAAQCRRFCLGCHIPADGVPGSQTVEGIVMNTLPDEEPHFSADPRSCYDCHGRDYSNPTGFNVHHPSEGEEAPGSEEGW